MQKTMKIISIIVFFTLLCAFMVLTVILPKSDFSENENRALTDFPNFSAQEYTNKSFMNNLDTYISDHFALRTSLMTVKSRMEYLSGKKLQNGIFFSDDRMVELVEKTDVSLIGKSIESINHLASSTETPVYVMLVPTAAGIYSNEIPSYFENVDQKAAIEDIYYKLDDNISTLNVFSKLHSAREEYIYYKNDHHWTSYGAYIAYNTVIRKMGYNPLPYNNYDVEHVNSQFRGTFYNKVLYSVNSPDVIDVYHHKSGNVVDEVKIDTGEEIYTSNSLYFSKYLNRSDKYSFFIENAMNPYVNITTSSAKENKILILKDSYAQCFVPFLTQHFSEITLVDLGSVGSSGLEGVVDINDYDQILILYNFSDFATDTNLKKLLLL